MIKFMEFFKKIALGYLRLLKWLGGAAAFIAILLLFNYLMILPLQVLAVNHRLIYNLGAGCCILAFLAAAVVKMIRRSGIRQVLLFLLLLLPAVVLIILPAGFNLVSVLASIPFLLFIFLMHGKAALRQGMTIPLIVICYANSLYRLALLSAGSAVWIAIPVLLFYLLFLGYILYEKKLRRRNKVFL